MPSDSPSDNAPDPSEYLGARLVIEAGRVLWDASGSVPEAVWHYTEAAGALGILRGRALWATHALFMNDASELRLAYPLLQDALTVVREGHPDNELLQTLIAALELMVSHQPKDPDVYAVCFCEQGDLLSQWRAYGISGGGYSLAFDGPALLADANRTYGLNLTRVIYEKSRQQELAQEIVARTVATFARHVKEHPDGGDDALHVAARSFSYVAQSYAYQIKDSAFAEEHEWRLIYARDPTGSLAPATREFRTGARGIVPYVSIPVTSVVRGAGRLRLDLGLEDLHLCEVSVGPTAHPETAALAMRYLLDDLGLREVAVTSSTIPLRA